MTACMHTPVLTPTTGDGGRSEGFLILSSMGGLAMMSSTPQPQLVSVLACAGKPSGVTSSRGGPGSEPTRTQPTAAQELRGGHPIV